MYNNRHNQPTSLNLNYFVPGLPLFDGIAASLTYRVIDLISRVFNFVSRAAR